MNVRFFAGSREEYRSIVKHSPIGLYFCHDSRELYWGNKLLSDGIRVVSELPSFETAADGVIYYIADKRSGWILSADGTSWIQVIHAPAVSVSEVPAGEADNTAVSVTALREIENAIFEKIASIENLNKIKTISFAGVALDRADGVFSIERDAALKALGISFTEGSSENEVEVVATKEYVDTQIAAIPEADLTGLATEEFVKQAIIEAELNDKDVDLSVYYTKSEVDALIPNTADFATKDELAQVETKIPDISELVSKTELQEAIDAIELPEADLSAYYTAEQTDERLQNYVTNETYDINQTIINNALNNRYSKTDADKRFALNANLNELSEKVDAISIPTKLSELENDTSFIKEIPAEYITESELEAKGYLTEHQDLTDYALKSDIPSVDGLASETFVKDEIAKIEIPDVSEFITEVPAEYITESELAAKGYITEHQSLAGYATEDYVKNAIAEAELNDKDVDISGLATKDEIKDLASTSYVDEKVAAIEIPEVPAKVSELENDLGFISSIPAEYVTEAELDSKGYLTAHQSLEAYAKKEELFSKDYNDLINKPDIPSLEGYAKTEDIPDVSKFITEVPAEYVTDEELNSKGYLTEHQDLSDYAKKSDIPTDYLTAIPEEYITEDELNSKGFITEHQSLEGYATEEYVAQQIEAIDLSDYAKAEDIPTDYLVAADLEGYSKFSGDYEDLINKPEIPSIDGLATEEFVAEAISEIEFPKTDLSAYSTTEETATAIANAVAEKADNIPFTTTKIVGKAIGGFNVGDDVKGMTMAEILAKLLELSDEVVEPDEPEIPDEPTSVTGQIIANELAMYSVNMNNELAASDFEILSMTKEEAAGEPTKSCFYQITDSGEVVESGYQELQILSDETYYVIALPKAIDYNTMIELQAYDSDEHVWYSCQKLPLTNDPDTVATLCDEAGIDISHIDTELYTVWASEELCTGSKLRYIIKEA